MLTSDESKVSGFILAFDGTSTILLPSRLNVFTVASSPGIPATTTSPLRATFCWRHTTKSPSRMPASIIESPRTFNMKSSPSPVKSIGSGTRSSTFSCASTLTPAATSPTSGM